MATGLQLCWARPETCQETTTRAGAIRFRCPRESKNAASAPRGIDRPERWGGVGDSIPLPLSSAQDHVETPLILGLLRSFYMVVRPGAWHTGTPRDRCLIWRWATESLSLTTNPGPGRASGASLRRGDTSPRRPPRPTRL